MNNQELQNKYPWLEKAAKYEAEGEDILSLSTIFLGIDKMMVAGKFQEIDEIIKNIDIGTAPFCWLDGIMVITRPAKKLLKERAAFLDKIEPEFIKRGHGDADLLRNMR